MISTSVFAASWDDLAATDSIYSELIEKVPSLGSETGIIVSKRESESVVNSLKQWTHIIASNKGSHNQPEYVDISEMRPAEVKKLTKKLFQLPGLFSSPAGLPENELDAIDSFAQKSRIKSYLGGHGNSFGSCGSVYLYDEETKQALILTACYSE